MCWWPKDISVRRKTSVSLTWHKKSDDGFIRVPVRYMGHER